MKPGQAPIFSKLRAEYNSRKRLIKKRLKDFSKLANSLSAQIFPEMCFCILTPQSKAVYCDKAVKILRQENLLFNGSAARIAKKLKGMVRFHNNKAAYITEARKYIKKITTIINQKNALEARGWLVKHIKGLGYKEASHFLRNIGHGENLAILDVHIMNNLVKYNVIKKIPKALSRKYYIYIENKLRQFSKDVKIPLAELDLLFWSSRTGAIFK